MNICVFGLWHLGSVISACLAEKGFNVTGLDFNNETISSLSDGTPPIFEPGLEELIKKNLQKGTLNFTNDSKAALLNSDLLWVAFDTPVDEHDNADHEFVINSVNDIFPYLKNSCTVLVSSQCPVGTTRKLEKRYYNYNKKGKVFFCYSPENLRLGKALEVFQDTDRFIVGIRNESTKSLLEKILLKFTKNIIWMSPESAEMTKHAVNSFLALSVTYANELASICESVGADAKDVEKGLKTESRIGPKAYLSPGSAFSGGTLARDVKFLIDLANKFNKENYLIPAIMKSNEAHKFWIKNKLLEIFNNEIENKKISILGLTYKPNTDTLRRSLSVELCKQLHSLNAKVCAFDPAIKELPSNLQDIITLEPSLENALEGSDATVIAVNWEMFKALDPALLSKFTNTSIVIDPNSISASTLNNTNIKYYTIGRNI